uniref:Uncharacterized protein n=1 Tax=Pseudonaja textilis TaxID=8673 RepID=A0A670XYQ2_PSETE
LTSYFSGGVVGAPLALSAVGFTAAGIAAGTLAAKMMSAAAIANGGGVAAGSLVALAQANLSASTKNCQGVFPG